MLISDANDQIAIGRFKRSKVSYPKQFEKYIFENICVLDFYNSSLTGQYDRSDVRKGGWLPSSYPSRAAIVKEYTVKV